MNFKVGFLLLIFLTHGINIFAKKKKEKQYISYKNGSYSYVHSERKTTGNIYELTIETCMPNVTIDSVWFGATPVPCEVYEPMHLHKVNSPLPKGKYIVKANKDLYKNFNHLIDSTQAYHQFVAPYLLNATLAIMYVYKGKRYYKNVSNIIEKPQKGLRD